MQVKLDRLSIALLGLGLKGHKQARIKAKIMPAIASLPKLSDTSQKPLLLIIRLNAA